MALLEREREVSAIEAVLDRGGVFAVEGGAGIGKTSLLQAACRRAEDLGFELREARGSELEVDFAFGVVRQLFERRLAGAGGADSEALLSGPAAAVRPLFSLQSGGEAVHDTSFAVLHGLYWLAANLASRRPLAIVVDDAHWADEPSLRWLAYLASRVQGLELALLIALRPGERASGEAPLLAVRAEASVVRPRLLSESAVAAIVRQTIGLRASDEVCATMRRASGGNPFYLAELLRAVESDDEAMLGVDPVELLAGAGEGVTQQVSARIRRLDSAALAFAQALAVLGDDSSVRHAAAIADVEIETAKRLAAGLVRVEVLAGADPPRFLHPIIRAAVEASLRSDQREAAHLTAAQLLYVDGAPPGQVSVHLLGVQPADDLWVLARLREAARAAIEAGAPQSAAVLLRRALAEPPPSAERVGVLRELARAEANAGRHTACGWLEEALVITSDPRARAEIALDVAETYAGLFRWVDAVDVIERALAELGEADRKMAGRLEGELVVAGMHDARRAARVGPVLERLATRHATGAPVEALAVARGMAAILAGRPAKEAFVPLEAALASAVAPVDNWDTRAALLWSLITAERFDAVESALEPMLAEVHRSGSARGLVATYSTLGLLKLRLGALPEADTAARVAVRVLQEGDFVPGLAFGATVLAQVAVESGELDEARRVLELLPQAGWAAGVGTVLIPAARARLLLAEGRPTEALCDFETCSVMFSADVWGMELRDVGYLHARSGAAQALFLLGQLERARALADAELADVRVFGGARALGVATRVAGLVHGGNQGLDLLRESVEILRDSPALLERAKSLAELGAALRRAGERRAAREPLADALDLAARCGARPVAARARDELNATGARPRREWRRGVEALTPSELRVARLAAEGKTNREIARSLYVTLKTVEGHLARTYEKLGISGRGDLAPLVEGEKTRVDTR